VIVSAFASPIGAKAMTAASALALANNFLIWFSSHC
jgi:hypothetical protein